MARVEAPKPPISRQRLYGVHEGDYELDEWVNSLLDNSEDDAVISPELIGGAFQSITATGGAEPDKEFDYSRLEDRIVELRDAGEVPIGKIMQDIEAARSPLEASGGLSIDQRIQLPRFIRRIENRAFQLWTEPDPPTRP